MLTWKVTLLALSILAGSAKNPAQINIYAETFIVSETIGNKVILTDFNGFQWAFYDTEGDDWRPGDIASCIMSDEGTPLIFDDQILSIKYSGYIEGGDELTDSAENAWN